MSATSDRDLLLGVMVHELGAMEREPLIRAMNVWAAQREKSLGDVLAESGRLGAQQRQWLERAVQRQLDRHGDARGSVCSLGAEDSVHGLLDGGAAPDLAASLKTMLSAGLAPGESVGRPSAPETRFRILRRHASGGLGDVFLAQDEELHREVALKEIQPRYADNADLRARFVLEAEITGGLEHPNIVPVYGLGCDAQGRPYYAMRFIRGESLLAAIARYHDGAARRSPGQQTLLLHKLLRSFVEVCNAAGYAHSRGVIHRDLKPENVMLGAYGETLLVDWGLAKLVRREESAAKGEEARPPSTLHPAAAGSPTPTRLGSVVGTLNYMSPEQAAGLVDQLRPASDIYGLGAMLYAILTGVAPFAGLEPDTVRQQIIAGRLPPPRQAKPGVPPALEAVCLKAMAQDPARRYATAGKLAEDVEAWLADEPVRAWREPWNVRAGRWMRRHRLLVGAGMAAVLVTAVSLTVGVVLLSAANERERTATALAQRRAEEARANFQMARDAVDKYLTRVSEDPRLKARDLERLRRDLLETARGFYEQFTRQQADNPDVQAAWGWAHVRLAALTAEIGSKQRSVELLEKAVAVFSELAARHPDTADYQQGMLRARLDMARLLLDLGRADEATATLGPAQAAAAAWADRQGEFRAALAQAHGLAATLALERKDLAAAEADYRAAITAGRRLVDQHPQTADYQSQLARYETGLGLLCRRLGRRDEAIRLLQSAADRNTALVDAHRDVDVYLVDLASACDNLAMLCGDVAGATAQLEGAYQKALAVRQRLLRAHPDVVQYQRDVARSHFNLAMLSWQGGQLAKAEASFRAAEELCRRLADEHADVPDYRDDLGAIENNLGMIYGGLGRMEEGLACLQKAVDLRRALVDKYPKNRLYLRQLASSHVNLGDALAQRGRADEAQQAYRGAIRAFDDLLARFPLGTEAPVELATLCVKAARLALDRAQGDEATALCRKAIDALRRLPPPQRDAPAAKAILRDAQAAISAAPSKEGNAK